MANYVSSLISMAENYKAAKDGNVLRHLSVVGHATKVVTKLASGQGPEAATKLCSTIVDTFDKFAEGSKVGKAVKTGVKAIRYTDQISATCAMIRACKSDTPARSFIEEASGIAGMFLVEGSMIKYAKQIGNIKGIKTLNDGMQNWCKGKGGAFKIIPAIVYGLLFTAGSEIGTKAFKKAGSWVADKLGLDKSKQKPEDDRIKVGDSKYYFG